jgi:hypothetical protein
MSRDSSIAVAVVFGGFSLVAAVAGFALLRGHSADAAPADTAYTPTRGAMSVEAGEAYCKGALRGVDCGCFARKASQFNLDTSKRAMGYSYADPWELARDQAVQGCS